MKKLLSRLSPKARQEHNILWSESGELVRDGMETSAWSRHPAPQMKREDWCSLNGTWSLDGKPIQVPYPPQSQLSGFQGEAGAQMTYEKSFTLPDTFQKPRVLLHFGAVDQVAEVWLNDRLVGRHEGGYLPFVFDITEQVYREGENRLRVQVTDTLSPLYPYGKQREHRGGMWYTPVSGIWQSVWLENVPEVYVKNIKITPDLHGVDITIEGIEKSFDALVHLENGEMLKTHIDGCCGRIELEGALLADGSTYTPLLWTPERPHLYPLTILAGEDRVESYFALRTIAIEKREGISRVCLNGQPVFLHGVLDQGYFCDGIYLPAREEEYEQDILRMKALGYNLLRKHIKVEPACFYEACDRLGMLVMQDMVNNGSYRYIRDTVLPNIGFLKKRDDRADMDGAVQQMFIKHTMAAIEHLYHYPSIIAYTIFNEGWGQFHSDELYRMVKKADPTRLADSTSGWFAQQENDFDSRHIYFKLVSLTPDEKPLFVTECGGYTMSVPGHGYSKDKEYGYGACKDSSTLTVRIEKMYRKMILPSIPAGVCGCIYTQLSDVEDEINGLYTYDRKVCKVEQETMVRVAEEMKRAVKLVR